MFSWALVKVFVRRRKPLIAEEREEVRVVALDRWSRLSMKICLGVNHAVLDPSWAPWLTLKNAVRSGH